eukprot:COSAG04_NODE_1261_length_7504_cov_2.488184_13_plen_64_part_00
MVRPVTIIDHCHAAHGDHRKLEVSPRPLADDLSRWATLSHRRPAVLVLQPLGPGPIGAEKRGG